MSKLSKASIEIIQCGPTFQFQRFLDGKLIGVSSWIETNRLSEDERKLTDSVGLTEKGTHYICAPGEEHLTLNNDPCPDCGTQLVSGYGGGVHCPRETACGYTFCF